MKHTPGPWRFDAYTSHGEKLYAVFCNGRSPDGVFLGTVGTQPESLPNARLVAAAPQMFAALELAYARLDDKAAKEEIGALLNSIHPSHAATADGTK